MYTKQQEKELIKGYLKGDQEATTKLLAEGSRLAVAIASKYVSEFQWDAIIRVHFEEGYKKAMTGFFGALYKYDLKSKDKFTTYATWFMKEAIDPE